MNPSAILRISLLLIAFTATMDCSSDNPVNNKPVSIVTETPQSARIYLGDTVRCVAMQGGVVDTAVRWTVEPLEGKIAGTISASGLYTAPETMPDTAMAVEIRAVPTNGLPAGGSTVILVMNQKSRPDLYPLRSSIESSYIFDSYSQDSAGAKIAGSDQSYGDVVMATGLNHLGRSEVSLATRFNDSLYIHYQGNGDIEVAYAGDNSWSLLPFASRSTALVHGSDTTFADGSRRSDTTRAIYEGEESIVLSDLWLLAEKVTLETKIEVSGGGTYSVAENATTYWLAPAIGWFTRVDEWTSNSHNGVGQAHGTSSSLRSYTLK